MGVPDGIRHRLEIRTQRAVTGNRPSTSERLRLPDVAPLLVVGGIRVQRPHQWSVLSFGAQPGIEFQRKTDVVAQANDVVHNALGNSVSVITRTGFPKHPQNVEIGREPQLFSPESSHRNDRELDSLAVATRQVEECLQCRGGNV